jgi:hypothetical protein
MDQRCSLVIRDSQAYNHCIKAPALTFINSEICSHSASIISNDSRNKQQIFLQRH